MQSGIAHANETDDWGETKDGDVEPIEFVEDIVESYRRKTLFFFESVLDVVIRNVGICGNRIDGSRLEGSVISWRIDGRHERGDDEKG